LQNPICRSRKRKKGLVRCDQARKGGPDGQSPSLYKKRGGGGGPQKGREDQRETGPEMKGRTPKECKKLPTKRVRAGGRPSTKKGRRDCRLVRGKGMQP